MGYLSDLNKKGIPFMEGRKKGSIQETLLGCKMHINDYGFIDGNDGEYAVLSFKGIDDLFYFGNSIVTDNLHKLEAKVGSKEAVLELFKDGCIVFEKRQGKNSKWPYYIACTLYDNENDVPSENIEVPF